MHWQTGFPLLVSDNMVFTQVRGFDIGALLGLQRQSLRRCVLACNAADTASLATWFLFGKLFGVATLFDFGEKRCRKNLPLYALVDMALSKRNSKPIAVDDVEFRWAVAARSQADTEMVTVVVQPPDNGCRLAVTVPCRDYWLNIQSPPPASYNIHAITPGFVRRLIDDARSLGWQPFSSGSQFTISCVLAEARGDAGETCHACWQCPDCQQSYSDDIEFGEQPPLMSSCGRSKHHSGGRSINVILFW